MSVVKICWRMHYKFEASKILSLALGIGVLAMFTLVSLFLVLELALKREGGVACWYA
jgi:hypothetical protein